MATSPTIPVHVRHIYDDLWTEVRVEATRRKVATADVLNEILRDWIERRAADQSATQKGDTTAGTA